MQEMKKRRIVLASVLKPVNDARMYEKMGASLARSEQYEIHIIGYPSNMVDGNTAIRFHPLKKFKRLSPGRLAARLKTLQISIKVKPDLLIVTTHDLLIVAFLIRILFGTKIIYDIQENNWRNILYTNAFPLGTRTLIAGLIRLKEVIISPFVGHFILAEKCYLNEMPFVKNKSTIVENKCKVPEGFQRRPDNKFIQLIFTGTLAESTGVFQAIDLAKKLKLIDPRIYLTIIGYGAQYEVLQKIEDETVQNPFIRLVGGKELVPHRTIMNVIATASFGMICYPVSPHLENKIPTKLFEYLACQLPILLQNHRPWVEMCALYDAAIVIDYKQPDAESILMKLRDADFYSKTPEGMTWESEEKKLLNLVQAIF
jgi:glycosyltransferase involved in cell wall biosynthesis